MFDNIGHKIKQLATAVCYIGISCSIISGIIILATDDNLIYLGLLVAVIGSLFSWISTFLLYGFGELIVRVTSIDEKMKGNTASANTVRHASHNRSGYRPTPPAPDSRPAAHDSAVFPALDICEADENETEETYLDACWLEEQQRYSEALQYFVSLGNYKDSSARAAHISNMIMR